MSPGSETSPTSGGLADREGRGTGTHVGRYVVLDEVGRGGMGRVLRAYDPKLRREVALKEVRAESLGAHGAQRLVAEARAMAKLSHPNVVAVYDVEQIGLDDVVVVMEYVDGTTLTQWLRRARRWPEVVAAFGQAGRGLAAAHAAGLLHRDFKPDNVLVAADGRVRVTDFGLAREAAVEETHDGSEPGGLDPGSGDETLTGGVVGTLPYLAPERLTGAPADPSTDEFAFCVALWEALFGARPFAGRSVIELSVSMAGGPPRPPPGAPRVPAALVATISRGLSTDPAERWPSMDALLGALARDAGGAGRRWVYGVAGSTLAGLLLLGAYAWVSRGDRCSARAAAAHLSDAWDQARRAQVRDAVLSVEASYATEAWARIERALDDYASAWTQMHVEACEATSIRGEQTEAVLDLRMACLHEARTELASVTNVLRGADAQTVQQADTLVAGLRPLPRCADIEALQADVAPPPPEQVDVVEAVRGDLARARALARAGRDDEARRALGAADARLADLDYEPVHVEAASVRGEVLDRNGEYEAARGVLREGLRRAAALRDGQRVRGIASYLVFVVGYHLHRYDEGLRYGEIARGLTEDDSSMDAALGNDVALVLDEMGEHERAEAEHRRVLALRRRLLGADDLAVASSHTNIAKALYAQGRFAEAEAEQSRALELRERLGDDHPTVATDRVNLAVMLMARGEYARAEAECRRALAVLEDILDANHPRVVQARNNLAESLYDQGEYEEAESEFRRAVQLAGASVGDVHPQAAWSRVALAKVLRARGRYEEAEAQGGRAVELLEEALGPEHQWVAQAHAEYAFALGRVGKHEQAEAEHRRALALRERSLGTDHPDVALSRLNLARFLLGRGESREAWRLAEVAWDRRQRDDIRPDERAASAFVLARACVAVAPDCEPGRAIEFARRALADYERAEGDTSEAIAEIRAWLREHDAGRE